MWKQIPLSSVSETRQWPQTEIQKIPFKRKKKLWRDQTLRVLEQVAQKGCAVSTLGNTQTEIDMTLSSSCPCSEHRFKLDDP